MSPDELKKVDLNLLVAFNALMEERNVSKAADRLNVTQPAMSRTLQRLRELFQDQLFVRTPKGLDPTSRSLDLQQPVNQLLGTIATLLIPTEFDPKQLERSFSLAMPAPVSALLLPKLTQELERTAPLVRIRRHSYTGDSNGLLSQGKLDFVVGFITDNIPASIHARKLMEDMSAVLMRKEHPLAGKQQLDLEDLEAYPHVKCWMKGINDKGFMESMGVQRFVAAEAPDMLSILNTLRATDAICVGMKSWQWLLDNDDIISVDMPEGIFPPMMQLSLLWDERCHNDPAHQWFRLLMYRLGDQLMAREE